MAIKRLNDVVPSVKRPLRLSDLQDIWAGLNQIFTDPNIPLRVLAGFNYDNGENLSAGVVIFNGQLYGYDGTEGIKQNTPIYWRGKVGESRVFANDNSYPFAYDMIVTATNTGQVLLSAAENTAANLKKLSIVNIPDESISTTKLDSSLQSMLTSLTTLKNNGWVYDPTLASDDVPRTQPYNRFFLESYNTTERPDVPTLEIWGLPANTDVPTQIGSIEFTDQVGSDAIQAGAVTTSKIATGAVSNDKLSVQAGVWVLSSTVNVTMTSTEVDIPLTSFIPTSSTSKNSNAVAVYKPSGESAITINLTGAVASIVRGVCPNVMQLVLGLPRSTRITLNVDIRSSNAPSTATFITVSDTFTTNAAVGMRDHQACVLTLVKVTNDAYALVSRQLSSSYNLPASSN